MAISDTDLVHPRRCVEPAREDLDAPYVPVMPHHLGKARAEDVVRRSGLA